MGELRAKCKYCPKDLACPSNYGTSNLWGHLLNKCEKYPFKTIDRKQTTLNIKPIKGGGQGDHKGETIAKGIEAYLLDWEIENKFTVTLDKASANDAIIWYLKGRINDWNGVILGNDFLHVQCNAHILNLIVKEELSEQNDSISRVKLDTHGLLSLDVETRWNSTYLMLNTAVQFEKAFSRMYIDDHKYFNYCLELSGTVVHPSSEDWKNVKVFLKFLEIFYKTTLKFLSTLHVTSNFFFHELFNLQSIIVQYSNCSDSILTDMARKMKIKFDKYWGDFEDINILLFFAVVLDPR
ncbi:zinc finger BED domain-containing protein RICESLEEPER 1-like [Lycium ferocissimum]|uniref:zinc finger BED domain-containing protein RICESLEEPER 1-like n=1 Tax=Lycium ferocissimum TaxID=112874 RepID=UPI0028167D2C|nr:zinc finger BED domain-containing protein RICESLEEPER 1-like [Lycium ferocissimum]